MSKKVAILVNPDNSISVVRASPKYTEEEVLEVFKKSNPKNLPITIVDESELPIDRVFRNAWNLSGGIVEIDSGKARNIHMDRLRHLRNKQLEKLDKEMMVAADKEDVEKVKEIRQLKQRLRDMTKTEDLTLLDMDTLKTHQPHYLEGDVTILGHMVFNK